MLQHAYALPLQDVGSWSQIRPGSGSRYRCRPAVLFPSISRLHHQNQVDDGPNGAHLTWVSRFSLVDHGSTTGSVDQISHLGHGVPQPSNVKIPLVDRLCFNQFLDLLHELASPFYLYHHTSINMWFLDPKQISFCLFDQNRSPYIIHIPSHCMSINTTYSNHNAITIILINQLVN